MSEQNPRSSAWTKRTYMAILLFSTLVFGPILFCEGPAWYEKGRTLVAATLQKADGASTTAMTLASIPELPPEPKVDIRTHGIEEVFRFDVSPHWVLDNWPRVTTNLGHLSAEGYRVSLVTGTDKTDLAGSLTYFFDPKQRVDKITFQGKTGDPARLINHLKRRFGFARRIANDPGLFLWETPGKGDIPTSYLHLRTSSLIQAEEQHRKYDVALVISRPKEK